MKTFHWKDLMVLRDTIGDGRTKTFLTRLFNGETIDLMEFKNNAKRSYKHRSPSAFRISVKRICVRHGIQVIDNKVCIENLLNPPSFLGKH